MKILKYVLIAIVSLVVIYLGIGLIHPSVYYGHEVMVDKPLEETWGVTQDNSKLPLWILGFKSIELISGEPGAVGSQYKVLVNPGQDQPDFEMTETIVSVEEFDHISLSFDSDMMEFEQTMTLAEKDGQVSIRTDSKVTGKGVMLKSMFALMEMIGGSFKEQEVNNLGSLKKVVEENTTDYYPAPVVPDTTLSEVEPTVE